MPKKKVAIFLMKDAQGIGTFNSSLRITQSKELQRRYTFEIIEYDKSIGSKISQRILDLKRRLKIQVQI